MKICVKCGVEWPLSNFYKVSAVKSGLDSSCKPCTRAKKLAWRTANFDRIAAQSRARYDRDKALILARGKEQRMARKYGISATDYERMSAEQGGVCAICQRLNNGRWDSGLYVDHDHATGRVRGLLCFSCNTALGGFRDSADLMRAGVDYLMKGRATDEQG